MELHRSAVFLNKEDSEVPPNTHFENRTRNSENQQNNVNNRAGEHKPTTDAELGSDTDAELGSGTHAKIRSGTASNKCHSI